jgi:hypothetical protein
MLIKSTEIQELIQALVAAQSEFSAIPKDSDNPFFKSKYAALPDVVKITTPVLSKHGLAVTQLVTTNAEGGDALSTMLMHTSGQYIMDTANLHLVKSDPQAHGSAITYMRRYSYMSILGLVADEDDDGNAASYPKQNAASAPAPKQNAQQTLGNAVAKAAGKPQSQTVANGKVATEAQTRAIWAITHKTLDMDDAAMWDAIDGLINRRYNKLTEMSLDEAKIVIEYFKSQTENN